MLKFVGYASWDSFTAGLREHRLLEAVKHAFAVRGSLGDPGDCSGSPGAACLTNLTSVLGDLLSPTFAAGLRCFCRLAVHSVHALLSILASQPAAPSNGLVA